MMGIGNVSRPIRPRDNGERLSLVDRLIASLNLPTQAEIDRLWAAEAERRLAQIDRGEVELIPGEQVFADIRAKYRR